MAFAKDMLNNTFRTTEQAEEQLGLTCLGLEPLLPKNKNEAPPAEKYLRDTRSVFAESINTIRTGLVFSNIDNPPQTLLVTSANSEEGKSTLAINLASAYSQIGRTLILEVDLRKPSLANYLGLKEQVGLSDLLTGHSTISEVLAKPYAPNLFAIKAGMAAHNPLETISSEKFSQLLTQLKQHFDHILLDCAPVLPVSDAGALGSKVDGVIFAVRAEKTSIRAAKEAVTRLKRLNVNVVGSVLTLAEPQKMSAYGDHYYVAEYYGSKTPEPA
ncbi:CpsD/CapB family tyrosine-protein kinase [Salinimonas marina]|uniref:CpsD/CapB family tyrosine-protein kinase n=1 Tax=Salinimonas marina TaxID=2785918 RepID=UPI001E597880|nr:CpsD/CapB family tyrosine-protein kinase [Salinimonas marina]